MQVVREMRLQHGWNGVLVLVGPRVAHGSSIPGESEFLMRHPDLREAVVRVPGVSEDEKRWLMERARLVLYPTTVEGFGLIPFEAANCGVPCLWAAQGSLTEVLPAELAGITAWDPVATARSAMSLLRDDEVRQAHVAAVLKCADRYRWDAFAERLVEVYATTADSAPRLAFAQRLYNPDMTELASQILGRRGLPEETQHMLFAISRRRYLSRLFFGTLSVLYRAGRRIARRGHKQDVTTIE
jgi:hypothetical protein